MNVKVIRCSHTGTKVLFDTKANMCLHNETKIDDIAEVVKFNLYTDMYLDYIASNGLDNDYNSISYVDLINFIENHIED